MKRTLLLLILLFASSLSFSQTSEDQKTLYASKVMKYEKMQKSGKNLIIAGSCLTVTGVGLIVASGYTADILALPGSLFVEFGIPAIIGGIVLKKIGKRKASEYQTKLNGLSVSLKYNTTQRDWQYFTTFSNLCNTSQKTF